MALSDQAIDEDIASNSPLRLRSGSEKGSIAVLLVC